MCLGREAYGKIYRAKSALQYSKCTHTQSTNLRSRGMALLRAERSNGFVTGNPSACPLLSQAVEPDEFCEPLERVNIGGETLDLNPCGLIANSMFNGERMGRGGAARACGGGLA